GEARRGRRAAACGPGPPQGGALTKKTRSSRPAPAAAGAPVRCRGRAGSAALQPQEVIARRKGASPAPACRGPPARPTPTRVRAKSPAFSGSFGRDCAKRSATPSKNAEEEGSVSLDRAVGSPDTGLETASVTTAPCRITPDIYQHLDPV